MKDYAEPITSRRPSEPFDPYPIIVSIGGCLLFFYYMFFVGGG